VTALSLAEHADNAPDSVQNRIRAARSDDSFYWLSRAVGRAVTPILEETPNKGVSYSLTRIRESLILRLE